jgi:hypothetical protein
MVYKDGVLPYPYYAGLVSVPGEKSTVKNTRLKSDWRKAELILFNLSLGREEDHHHLL